MVKEGIKGKEYRKWEGKEKKVEKEDADNDNDSQQSLTVMHNVTTGVMCLIIIRPVTCYTLSSLWEKWVTHALLYH